MSNCHKSTQEKVNEFLNSLTSPIQLDAASTFLTLRLWPKSVSFFLSKCSQKRPPYFM